MKRDPEDRKSLSRRDFVKTASGAGAAALAGLGAADVSAAAQSQIKWDRVADVVVAGAGASGLPAAITARDHGCTVIVIDANHDIGGHAMISGGRVPLGGGTSMQKKYGITDSADVVYSDHTNYRNPVMRYCDRDLVRVWANENAPTFEFLIENGVKFDDVPPTIVNEGTIPRLFIAQRFSDNLNETINGSPGSGVVRPLERSARAKGVELLLRHKLTKIIRVGPSSGRVLGIAATFEGRDVNIRARKGVILATGGHTTNVEFRRTWDPRLTEEYQVAGVPWSYQNGDGEVLALSIGAALWATANQTVEAGAPISKTRHIGCRYGYVNLKWDPGSPMFKLAGASGLTVKTFQDVILVNRRGVRFWNEMDDSFAFLDACLGAHGDLGKNGKTNGGGPIWAIFDSDAVKREGWNPRPPDVDPNGWFFSADTLAELARRIVNPYQLDPMPGKALEETVAKYNSYADAGKDGDFGKPTPLNKIQTSPFYAAWSTPILHDTLSGLRINQRCQVIDIRGQVISGLYAAGEVAGGFALHGLPRVIVFGRIAGKNASTETPETSKAREALYLGPSPAASDMKHLIIEIKARCNDHKKVRDLLVSRCADFKGTDHQIDTYFRVSHGRLKLREGNIENFLVCYGREDKAGPKQSNVILFASDPKSSLKEILVRSLGTLVVVEKSREIYFVDNVKFHIDTVKDLGTFMEIEAIGNDGDDPKERLLKQCNEYLSLFGIQAADLISVSYSDLLLANKGNGSADRLDRAGSAS